MNVPESMMAHLLLIAGRGLYPVELARAARRQGVRRLSLIAFRGETDREAEGLADDTRWIHVGQLGALLDAAGQCGARDAVMAGQVRPTHIFRVRLDRAMLDLLKRLPVRNAHTVFGALGDALSARGIVLRPAWWFMESAMPAAGLLGGRAPTEREQADLDLGRRVAKATSALEIGQTVVVKEGILLAVEALEGTDAAILRAGQLGGPGAVVVKTARTGHDMRFDIPVVGLHTFRSLRRIRAAALAVEAGRTILLEREKLAQEAARLGMCFLAFESDRSCEGRTP